MLARASISVLFFSVLLCSCKQQNYAEDIQAKSQESNMKGFITNIEKDTIDNNYYRRVLYTAKYSQLVLMSLEPNEEIGEETHHLDQFIRIEAGEGRAILNSIEHKITDGSALVIPAGVKHNIINGSKNKLKIYTVYSPPEHKDGTIHKTKAEALMHEEEFDGKTTE
jgi:mannose-6-phosphate isomerase-like protein (cupin superfamily)